jgi:hypothetical protein
MLLVINLGLEHFYRTEQLTYSCRTANIVEMRVPLTNQMILGLNEIFICFTKDEARRQFEKTYGCCVY